MDNSSLPFIYTLRLKHRNCIADILVQADAVVRMRVVDETSQCSKSSFICCAEFTYGPVVLKVINGLNKKFIVALVAIDLFLVGEKEI